MFSLRNVTVASEIILVGSFLCALAKDMYKIAMGMPVDYDMLMFIGLVYLLFASVIWKIYDDAKYNEGNDEDDIEE